VLPALLLGRALQTRTDRIYEDKLDGKIDEALCARKISEGHDQERTLQTALASLSAPITTENVLTVK
jgi:hypothetical protein